jgi:hypothetical protein
VDCGQGRVSAVIRARPVLLISELSREKQRKKTNQNKKDFWLAKYIITGGSALFSIKDEKWGVGEQSLTSP